MLKFLAPVKSDCHLDEKAQVNCVSCAQNAGHQCMERLVWDEIYSQKVHIQYIHHNVGGIDAAGSSRVMKYCGCLRSNIQNDVWKPEASANMATKRR